MYPTEFKIQLKKYKQVFLSYLKSHLALASVETRKIQSVVFFLISRKKGLSCIVFLKKNHPINRQEITILSPKFLTLKLTDAQRLEIDIVCVIHTYLYIFCTQKSASLKISQSCILVDSHFSIFFLEVTLLHYHIRTFLKIIIFFSLKI